MQELENSSSTSIEEEFKDAPKVVGYLLNKEGLFIERENDKGEKFNSELAQAPFWYNGCSVDIDTSESIIELKYIYEGQAHSLNLSRSAIYSSNWINQLAGNYKLPIAPSAGIIKDIATYLYKADLACKTISYTSTHAGWHTLPNGTKEYVPFSSIKPNPRSEGIKQRFSYITSKGDEKLWCDTVFDALEQNTLAAIPFAGALAAPLLSLLEIQSVVIDIHTTSSSGKTIAGLMAMSIFGRPDKLKLNWDSTQVALEENATAFSDLPLFFDESQLNTYPKGIGTSIYNVANGTGRERGAIGGGTRVTGTWSTVLISTGEASLLSLIPQNFAGLDARIIPVKGKTLGAFNAQQAQSIATLVKKNYGFLAPKYIEHVKTLDLVKLQDSYLNYVDMLRKDVVGGDAIQMRKAETYASLLIAVDQLLIVEPAYSTSFTSIFHNIVEYWQKLCVTHQGDQVAEKALRILLDYYRSNPSKFVTSDKNTSTRVGSIYKRLTGFIPTNFEEILKKHKLSPENILTEFEQRGWLERSKDGKSYKVRTTIDGVVHQLFVLSKKAEEHYESLQDDHLASVGNNIVQAIRDISSTSTFKIGSLSHEEELELMQEVSILDRDQEAKDALVIEEKEKKQREENAKLLLDDQEEEFSF